MARVHDRSCVTMKEAADMAGVNRRTIYNWLKAGKIEAVRTAGGCLRIFEDSLFREIPPGDPAAPPDATRLDPPPS